MVVASVSTAFGTSFPTGAATVGVAPLSNPFASSFTLAGRPLWGGLGRPLHASVAAWWQRVNPFGSRQGTPTPVGTLSPPKPQRPSPPEPSRISEPQFSSRNDGRFIELAGPVTRFETVRPHFEAAIADAIARWAREEEVDTIVVQARRGGDIRGGGWNGAARPPDLRLPLELRSQETYIRFLDHIAPLSWGVDVQAALRDEGFDLSPYKNDTGFINRARRRDETRRLMFDRFLIPAIRTALAEKRVQPGNLLVFREAEETPLTREEFTANLGTATIYVAIGNKGFAIAVRERDLLPIKLVALSGRREPQWHQLFSGMRKRELEETLSARKVDMATVRSIVKRGVTQSAPPPKPASASESRSAPVSARAPAPPAPRATLSASQGDLSIDEAFTVEGFLIIPTPTQFGGRTTQIGTSDAASRVANPWVRERYQKREILPGDVLKIVVSGAERPVMFVRVGYDGWEIFFDHAWEGDPAEWLIEEGTIDGRGFDIEEVFPGPAGWTHRLGTPVQHDIGRGRLFELGMTRRTEVLKPDSDTPTLRDDFEAGVTASLRSKGLILPRHRNEFGHWKVDDIAREVVQPWLRLVNREGLLPRNRILHVWCEFKDKWLRFEASISSDGSLFIEAYDSFGSVPVVTSGRL